MPTLMKYAITSAIVTRSWISDTPDEVEHPPIPLGLNEMTVPRLTIVLSISTLLLLISSSVWLALSAISFLEDLDETFGSNEIELLEMEGRWVWEVDLLFDTCRSREDSWNWPSNLSDQDDTFLYPGELECDWEHQGEGDGASVVVYNRGETDLDLLLEINGEGVIFSESGENNIIINQFGANNRKFLEIRLQEDIEDRGVSIIASHTSVMQAEVRLDVQIYRGPQERDVHIGESDSVEVEYTVWNYDTGDELDSGTWIESAGEPRWSIEGFGWSVIGLDIDNDRGSGMPVIDTGTSHITLLPPPIGYGNSEGHELQHTWLKFELKLERALATD